jgi:hypothetical protein
MPPVVLVDLKPRVTVVSRSEETGVVVVTICDRPSNVTDRVPPEPQFAAPVDDGLGALTYVPGLAFCEPLSAAVPLVSLSWRGK